LLQVGIDVLRLGAEIYNETHEWQQFADVSSEDEEDESAGTSVLYSQQSADDSASIGRLALELTNLKLQAENYVQDLLAAAPDRQDIPSPPELPSNLTALPLAELDKLNRQWLKHIGKLEHMALF
jgi:hypothetical protein